MSVIIRSKTKDGRVIALYLDISYGGKRKRVALKSIDMREAKKVAADVERRLLTEGWGKGVGEQIKFDQFIDLFLDYSRATKAVKTVITERDSLRAFAKAVGKIELGDIGPQHLEAFRIERLRNVKATSVNVALRHIKAAFNWAVERGLLKESPAAKVRLNRVPKNLHPRFLSEAEVERLRAEIGDDPELLHVVNFGLWTGMRRNEIVNVRWSDIDLDRRTITVQNRVGFQTKSGRSRVIPINPALHTMLSSLLHNEVLPAEHVFPINYWSLGKRFLLAVRRAKIDGKVSLHTLRHTFASHLVMKGVDLASIQEILGHHDVTVTMIYSHVSPQHLARTVEKLPY
jgi:integrase